MRTNIIRDKSLLLARAVIKQVTKLEAVHEYVLSKQLLRAGTSVGANVFEAISAESRKDFLHKLQISLKEARECEFWLEILETSNYKSIAVDQKLKEILNEVVKLLVAITRILTTSP